jgi:hypothetical protein
MRQYRINFKGSNDSESWPQYHSAIFTAIQNMRHVTFTKYADGPQPHSPQKSKLMKKADKLVFAADYCRRFDVNEQTWRDKTESPLLSQVFTERMEW